MVVLSAYREFEQRVGSVSAVKGAKTAMVLDTIGNMPRDFSIKDLQERCPTVGIDLDSPHSAPREGNWTSRMSGAGSRCSVAEEINIVPID